MTIMMFDPELAHAIHQWIVDAYIILVNHFGDLGNLPVTSIHVGECAGTMISSDLFEDFVVPYISQLGDQFGSIRLHSCGISDHLIDSMSHIRYLNIIDTGSGTSIENIRQVMGPDFVIHIAPPMELMMEGVPKSEILAWLDKTLVENNNGPLQIAYHAEPDYDINNCLCMHDELERRGLVTYGRLY